MILESFSSKETKNIGQKFGQEAKSGDIFCLQGDLGTGKTIFSKGFALGMNITEHITSPTFSILNIYESDIPLYHFDVYRIIDLDSMEDTNYEDYFYGTGVCLIEWADNIKELIPENAYWIYITKDFSKGEDYRKIEIKGERF